MFVFCQSSLVSRDLKPVFLFSLYIIFCFVNKSVFVSKDVKKKLLR